MMSARVAAENLTVEHVRKPRQRMPVARMPLRERPDDSFLGQPAPHDQIFGDVIRIIRADEWIMQRPRINSEGGNGQQKAKENFGAGKYFWRVGHQNKFLIFN